MAVIDEPALIDRWVEGDPSGATEARLAEYGVEVWALVGFARGAGDDPAAVARAYEVPVEAVQAALAYYRQHPREVDAHLEANQRAHAG